MKYSLIELVQRILEACDSDEVNTISDTGESLAVANIVKECYFDLVGEVEPGDSESLFHLTPSGDNTKPTVMYLPDNVVDIHWLKYTVPDPNGGANSTLRDLCYLPLDDFFVMTDGLDLDENWVDTQTVTISGQNFVFKFRTDESPRYWTTVDGGLIVLDSFDSENESTVMGSRVLGYGQVVQTFQMVDTFVPNLNPRQFQLLLQEAKAQAFIELKQTENAKAEKKAKRNKILAYKSKDLDPRSSFRKQGGWGRSTPGYRILGSKLRNGK